MPAATSLRFEILPMTADDWPAVRQIYLDGLATGQASFETTAPSREQWDAGHLECCRLVARVPDTPSDQTADMLGWAALSPVSRRACYRGVAEVSVYIAARARGHGVGRVLLEALIAASEADGIWTLQASIFPENVASVRLHESTGFRLVGRRERIAQHHGRWRDTVILERRSARIGLSDAQSAP